MATDMDLSVIVPTYNHCHLLERTLAQLRRQTVPPTLRWELLVVDNNCTDATPELLRRTAEGFPVPLRCLREPEQGVSSARNRGVAEARGDYLAFTDDDTFPDEGWLAAIWRSFEAHRCHGVVGKIGLAWLAEPPRWLTEDLYGFLGYLDYGPAERPLITAAEPPNGGNMAFARAVFDKIGGFDPTLGRKRRALWGGEEPDFFRRFLAAGLTAVYQPGAVVNHAMEAPRLRKAYFRRVHFLSGQTAGLRLSPQRGRSVIGVPLFTLPQLFRSLSTLGSAAWREGLDRSLRKEMNAWHLLGFMLGCAKRRGSAGPER